MFNTANNATHRMHPLSLRVEEYIYSTPFTSLHATKNEGEVRIGEVERRQKIKGIGCPPWHKCDPLTI